MINLKISRLKKENSRIPAIKLVRTFCDNGLREAKDMVDALQYQSTPIYISISNDSFQRNKTELNELFEYVINDEFTQNILNALHIAIDNMNLTASKKLLEILDDYFNTIQR